MLDIILRGRRHWSRGEIKGHRALRHLLEANEHK
jgi:hypothetical protein